MRALEGMLVRLQLAKTRKGSDTHTALTRISVEGDQAVARCVVCRAHRITLTPKMINFLLTFVATFPGAAKDAIVTIKDGTYDPPPAVPCEAGGRGIKTIARGITTQCLTYQ